MILADYYLGDSRLVLVPIEHLSAHGMSAPFAAVLAERRGWPRERSALLDAGFARYWERSASLARRTHTWPAPRVRHIAVAADPLAVRPYVQLLNTSAWLLYDGDLDPACSHPEFVAYLLVHGDRMALAGEVANAAVHCAAYWFDRSDEERAAFAAAAARSSRPDADGFRALADATAWLRRLRHETLAPPTVGARYRAIPGTGLFVPVELEREPEALVASWTDVARRALAAFRAAWRTPDLAAVRALSDWLAAEAPPLLVTAQGGRIVWDPQTPQRLGALRAELKQADGVAVRSIADDLRLVAHHTRAFHAALADPAALPPPPADTEQCGYTYLHHRRGVIAYNLREPGMERLHGPPLPYARAMLGARTVHEWAHLAVAAGWVPVCVSAAEFAARRDAFARQLEAVVAAAPPAVRRLTAADLTELAGARPPAEALTDTLLLRMPDFQANLLARRFLDEDERETYVRHNVRTLRPEYPPARLWRMLVRYLYEYQYLGLSSISDRRAYFLHSTWFEQDFLSSGVLDVARFDALTACVAALCASYDIDEGRFRGLRARPPAAGAPVSER